MRMFPLLGDLIRDVVDGDDDIEKHEAHK